MDFVEKWNFFLSAFFTEIISENIFFDIVERKDYFKWKKIEVLKRTRKWTFFKGVSPRFCPKIIISIICVFHWNYVTKEFFSIFMKEKNDFKWKKLKFWKKGQKMDIFLKGLVHRFCPKIELFLIGVFYKNHIRKHCFWYCRKKRMILSRKTLKF